MNTLRFALSPHLLLGRHTEGSAFCFSISKELIETNNKKEPEFTSHLPAHVNKGGYIKPISLK